jgi:hypothetical protein
VDPTKLARGWRDLVPFFAVDALFPQDFNALPFLQAHLGGVVTVAETTTDSRRDAVLHSLGEAAVFKYQVFFGNPTVAALGRSNR